jgi:hypothetical protein
MTGLTHGPERYARGMRNPGENASGRVPGRRQGGSGRTSPPDERSSTSRSGTGRAGSGSGRQGTGGRTSRGDGSIFTPGYSGGRAAADRDPVPAGHGWYGSPGDAAGKGPVRGFPPAPGQPPPLYPPGPFAAWNRTPAAGDNGYETGDAWPGMGSAGSAVADYPPGAAAAAGNFAAGYADVGYSDRGYADTGHTGQGAEAGYAEPGNADSGYADPGHHPEPGYPDPGYSDPAYPHPGYSALAVSDPAADVTSTQGWQAVDDAPPASAWPGDRDPRQADGPAGHLTTGPRQPADTGPQHPFGDGPRQPFSSDPDHPFFTGPNQRVATGPNQPFTTGPNQRVATGPNQRPGTGPNQRVSTGPNQRVATGPHQPFGDGPDQPFSTGPLGRVDTDPAARPGRGRDRSAAGPGTGPGQVPPRGPSGRGRGSRGKAKPKRAGRARVLLISGIALVVVIAAAAYLLFATNNKQPSPSAASRADASARPSSRPSASPTPSLGPWGHIESRALDPTPLTLAELFPAQFTEGSDTYTRTVAKARAHCAAELVGSALTAAVSHAGCTQAMRASYLSANPKLMGTIGVLNLVTATAAEKAGKAAGPSEYIAQLAGPKAPTKNLTKGTGFEAAEVKGHYLVLVWAEFTNLRAPKTSAQKAELESFISLLMQQTANVSLATRQVTGSPPS